MYRRVLVVCALLWLASCKSSPPPNVAATVNSRPITYTELDKQYQLQFPQNTDQPPSEEQVMIQKLEVLRTMIDSEILLQRAEKAGLMAVDSDVDAKLNELKAPYTQEEFQRQLTAKKLTLDDMKAQLRRDLSILKLLNKEVTSKINISDKDISDFYNANRAGFHLPEPQLHIASILVTPKPDDNVRNLKNDKAKTEEQARAKIMMLENRVRQGEDFGMLAQNFSEDQQSAGNGGDLGFIAESALEKVTPDVRKAILGLKPGQVSHVVRTPEGYRLFRLLGREGAGQRELSDPLVQQRIREQLQNRKDQLLKAAYYEVARNSAQLANYLASSIVVGKK
jgi:peptidyl-prolyl cis-trans isomerase SurA